MTKYLSFMGAEGRKGVLVGEQVGIREATAWFWTGWICGFRGTAGDLRGAARTGGGRELVEDKNVPAPPHPSVVVLKTQVLTESISQGLTQCRP